MCNYIPLARVKTNCQKIYQSFYFVSTQVEMILLQEHVISWSKIDKKNRKPCNLPLEIDIRKFKYMLEELTELLNLFYMWTSKSYVLLRDIICSWLTINGRRGEEIGGMLMEEWKQQIKVTHYIFYQG